MIPFTTKNYIKTIDEDLCRWMEDRKGEGDFLCHCDRIEGKPYCKEHTLKAYKSPPKQLRAPNEQEKTQKKEDPEIEHLTSECKRLKGKNR